MCAGSSRATHTSTSGAGFNGGNKLNKTELNILEHAGKDCKVRKVTKLSVAVACKGSNVMEVHSDPVPVTEWASSGGNNKLRSPVGAKLA